MSRSPFCTEAGFHTNTRPEKPSLEIIAIKKKCPIFPFSECFRW